MQLQYFPEVYYVVSSYVTCVTLVLCKCKIEIILVDIIVVLVAED